MKKRVLLLGLVCLLVLSSFVVMAASAGEVQISDSTVRMLGRTVTTGSGTTMNWPLSGVEFSFTGTEAEIYVSSKSGTVYVDVCIDGSEEAQRILVPSNGWLTIAKGLPSKIHTIRFVRSSEAWAGKLSVSQVRVATKTGTSTTYGVPKPTEEKGRKIMFVGDSYTAGYGNMATDGDVTLNTDAWTSWAGYTARALNADVHAIAYAGKGILNGRGSYTMPQEFEFADCVTGLESTVQWDHSKFQPQVIVVFLGTNDGAYGLDEFCSEYVAFLINMRKNYPGAKIICFGKQDSPSGTNPGNRMTECVTRVAQTLGGPAKGFYPMTLTSFRNTGIHSHPLSSEQKVMSNELVTILNGMNELWGSSAQPVSYTKQDQTISASSLVSNWETKDQSYTLMIGTYGDQNGKTKLQNVKSVTKVIPGGQTMELKAQLNDGGAEAKVMVLKTKSLEPILPVTMVKDPVIYLHNETGEDGEQVSVYQVNSFE